VEIPALPRDRGNPASIFLVELEVEDPSVVGEMFRHA
jgi:hypothetical protein